MFLRILTTCLLLCTGASYAATPTDEEIVEQIYRQVTEFEEKYPGTYSRRSVTVRQLDPDDGEVRETKSMVQEVWARVGQKARVEILSCSIDGQASDIDDCKGKDRSGDPPYRIFGPDGHKHYRFEVARAEEADGVPVYALRVIPREKTKRHSEGELYFATEDLRLIRSTGTIADYPLGLRDLAFDLSFDQIDGLPVPATSKMDMTLYVPLIYDVRIVSESTSSDQKLLPRDQQDVSAGTPGTDSD